jgi:hypothetical protein
MVSRKPPLLSPPVRRQPVDRIAAFVAGFSIGRVIGIECETRAKQRLRNRIAQAAQRSPPRRFVIHDPETDVLGHAPDQPVRSA